MTALDSRGASAPSEHAQPGLRVALVAVVAAFAGLFLTGVGAGVAFRFAAKTGLSWTSVLGTVVLVAGIAALGFVWATCWRAARRWQRLWFVPGAIVGLLILSSITQGTMLAYGPRTGLGSLTPAARGLAYTDVTFRTSDGVLLSAWFLPSTDPAATEHAAILTVPGAGSNRTATLGQAAVLVQHGYGVLMLDPRGQGRSGGRAMDAGWYGERDLAAAVGFLRHRPGVDPGRIGILGLSMGGEEAIGAAGADPAIRAVLTEGATHRTAADKAGYLPGGLAGAVQRGLDRITYATAALLSPAPEPGTLYAAIRRASSTRFLLIAAARTADEREAVTHLRTAAPDRVQTWTVAGATHTHGLTTSAREWTDRVTSFFDCAFGVGTSGAPG